MMYNLKLVLINVKQVSAAGLSRTDSLARVHKAVTVCVEKSED